MKRRRKKKSKNLGRASLTVRQALTQAEIATENGDCVAAHSLYKEAVAGDAHDKKMVGPARFDEVKRTINRCKMTGFSGAKRPRFKISHRRRAR